MLWILQFLMNNEAGMNDVVCRGYVSWCGLHPSAGDGPMSQYWHPSLQFLICDFHFLKED